LLSSWVKIRVFFLSAGSFASVTRFATDPLVSAAVRRSQGEFLLTISARAKDRT
jgi:hypothetical protein